MRIFVGVDLDSEIRARIERFVEGVRGFAPDARWARPESLHITLKFIGEQTAAQVEAIVPSHRGAVATCGSWRVRNSLRRIRILSYRQSSARILDRDSVGPRARGVGRKH